MRDTLLMGIGRYMIPLPRFLWQWQVSRNARRTAAGLGFMTAEHHLVRDYVVTELPRAGRPLPPEAISRQLGLPVARVNAILDELERRKTFLFRDEQGAVAWAYPVTVDRTPHQVTFSTGEPGYAA